MQFRKFLAFALVCACFSLPVYAQQAQNIITGRILSDTGEPVPGSVIQIDNSKIAVVSDGEGYFKFKDLPDGSYSLSISAMGMETLKKKISVKDGKTSALHFSLKSSVQQMNTVSVVGTTAAQEVKRQSYAVNAIDVKPLQNSSLDLNQVVGRTSGVRVREDGGMGSSFNFSLNGFSGKQVKFFLDGIPMENFGAALSLNNIPVNLAERIEIYKGVVPIWLGSDALGGAINIVSNNKIRNFLDVSYSYGSFNTHRAAISGGYTEKKTGFQVLVNVFKNHSDNDYWVNTKVMAIEGNKISDEEQRVRRFHDTYNSESIQVETGLVGKKYADRLLIGIVLAQNYREIQTGAQMSRVYGGWFQRSNTIMPTLKYQKKDFLIKNLQLNVYGSYNFGETQNVDTLNRLYNWLGEYKDGSIDNNGVYKYSPGGESARSLYKFRNNAGIVNANLNYVIGKNHSVSANYIFSTFDRKGMDVLRPQEESIRQPQGVQKNILGFGYKFDYDKRLSASVFGKYYFLNLNATQRVDIYTDPRWAPVESNLSILGYGAALSYFLIPAIQLKASYEKTYRLPEGEEIFGDGINQVANKALRPESSDNINGGFIVQHSINEKHNFSVEANYFYRDAKDFIRIDVSDTRTQALNIRDIFGSGVDGQIGYNYKNMFNAGVNVTYQKMINATLYESADDERNKNVSSLKGAEIPNIPFLYGNAEMGINFKNAFVKESVLGISYHLNYVAEYFLKWGKLGNREKSIIPEQLSHDIQLTYSLKKGRYNISLGCLNITDTKLYDNYLMQKPGRALNVKLRYFLSK